MIEAMTRYIKLLIASLACTALALGAVTVAESSPAVQDVIEGAADVVSVDVDVAAPEAAAYGNWWGYRYGYRSFHCTSFNGWGCNYGHYHLNGRCHTILNPQKSGTYVYGGTWIGSHNC